MLGWDMVKKIILFILVASCLENNLYSAGYWYHFKNMDRMDHSFSSRASEDYFGYKPTWKNLFWLYKDNKLFFIEARIKNWEGNPQKKALKSLIKYKAAYVQSLDGSITKYTL